MCYCPICKLWCSSGSVKGQGMCVFWDDKAHCLIRMLFMLFTTGD